MSMSESQKYDTAKKEARLKKKYIPYNSNDTTSRLIQSILLENMSVVC